MFPNTISSTKHSPTYLCRQKHILADDILRYTLTDNIHRRTSPTTFADTRRRGRALRDGRRRAASKSLTNDKRAHTIAPMAEEQFGIEYFWTQRTKVTPKSLEKPNADKRNMDTPETMETETRTKIRNVYKVRLIEIKRDWIWPHSPCAPAITSVWEKSPQKIVSR